MKRSASFSIGKSVRKVFEKAPIPGPTDVNILF
jgi:hypothetical protein